MSGVEHSKFVTELFPKFLLFQISQRGETQMFFWAVLFGTKFIFLVDKRTAFVSPLIKLGTFNQGLLIS